MTVYDATNRAHKPLAFCPPMRLVEHLVGGSVVALAARREAHFVRPDFNWLCHRLFSFESYADATRAEVLRRFAYCGGGLLPVAIKPQAITMIHIPTMKIQSTVEIST